MSHERSRFSATGNVSFYDTQIETAAPLRRLLLMVAVVLLIIAFSVWVALNPKWVLGLGHWGYLGAFLIGLISSATVILPAPGLALLIAMGTALDPIIIGIVAAAGSSLGELTGYFAGATGAALIPEQQRPRFERIHFFTGKYGASVILFLAMIPFPFFDLVGIIAGIMRMAIPVFLGAVFVGNSLKYTFIIWLGAGPLYVLLHYFYTSIF